MDAATEVEVHDGHQDRLCQVNRLRFKKFPVLGQGFATLVDCMGEDSSVVQAARVSYGAGTKTPSDDRTLLRYMLRHEHTSPFEMCELKFLVKVPMDAWRQWIRHRTASVNEYSTRYSVAIDEQLTTDPNEWRSQSTTNRQGSGDFIDPVIGETLTVQERLHHQQAKEMYAGRIEHDVAREQARKDLPLSTFTMAYWKIDLHNLMHFLKLRMNPAAQLEIRSYAEIIGNEIVRPLFPNTWEAFVDYQLDSVQLSRLEQELMRNIFCAQAMNGLDMHDIDRDLQRWKENNIEPPHSLAPVRMGKGKELDEAIAKMRDLGFLPSVVG